MHPPSALVLLAQQLPVPRVTSHPETVSAGNRPGPPLTPGPRETGAGSACQFPRGGGTWFLPFVSLTPRHCAAFSPPSFPLDPRCPGSAEMLWSPGNSFSALPSLHTFSCVRASRPSSRAAPGLGPASLLCSANYFPFTPRPSASVYQAFPVSLFLGLSPRTGWPIATWS